MINKYILMFIDWILWVQVDKIKMLTYYNMYGSDINPIGTEWVPGFIWLPRFDIHGKLLRPFQSVMTLDISQISGEAMWITETGYQHIVIGNTSLVLTRSAYIQEKLEGNV